MEQDGDQVHYVPDARSYSLNKGGPCFNVFFRDFNKAWEFGYLAGGGHFTYGSFIEFGYRDLDDMVAAISDTPHLPMGLGSQHCPQRWPR